MAKPGSTTAWLASSAAGLDSWSGVGPVTIRLALLCYMTPRIGVVIDDDAEDVTLTEWSMECYYLPSRDCYLYQICIYIYAILLFKIPI
jgi:hypothetical protein